MAVLDDLKKSVLEFDSEGAADAARRVIDEGLDPVEGLAAISEAMDVVGDNYTQGQCFLPSLVGAASAAKEAMPILEEEIKARGQQAKGRGTVVIGTVSGDIHSIGKSMVGVLLMAAGFRVVDLGVDISTEQFVDAVRDHDADVLALSALLTTTAPQQGKVIQALKEQGLRDGVKIMVGGGAISAQFGDSIGADGYEATAPGAVRLAKALVDSQS